MASIQSLPAEVCTQIFGNLDVNSALALASTCKGLGAVLETNQQAIAKEIVTDIILQETGHVCHATVKLAFMAVEAKRIREVRDIDTLLVFQQSFVGVAAKAKNWIKLAGGIPKLIEFIYKLVMPNLTCFPVEDKIMCLSFNEKGRMIRAILAAETVCNMVQCVQGNYDTPWGNSIRMSRKFWLQFSRHEGKQMDGIMAGLQALRESIRSSSTIPTRPAAHISRRQTTLLCIVPETPAMVLHSARETLCAAHQLVAVVYPHKPFPAFAAGVPRCGLAGRPIGDLRRRLSKRFDPFVWATAGRSACAHILDEQRVARILAARPAWEPRRGFHMGAFNVLYFKYATPAIEARVVEGMGGHRRLAGLLPALDRALENGLELR